MEVKEIHYHSFGKCVKISNGIIEVIVTIDLGPRIVAFGLVGEDNIFYEDAKRAYRITTETQADGNDTTFYYYGGHRLWLSKERSAKSVWPDNEPVVYSVLSDSVRFSPPRQKSSAFQTGMEIVMSEGTADIMIVHTAKNCSQEAQNCGISAITMLAGDGLLILPQNTEDDITFRPNRSVVLWPGTDIRDKRLHLGNRYLSIRQETGCSKLLKIGSNNLLGWAAFVGAKYTFLERYVHNPQAVYPDFGSSCELCLQPDFSEIQSLSPIYRVEPGMGIKHVENLSIFRTRTCVDPEDEDGVERYFNNLN